MLIFFARNTKQHQIVATHSRLTLFRTTNSFLLAPVPLSDGLLHFGVGLKVALADRRLVGASSARAPSFPKENLSVTAELLTGLC